LQPETRILKILEVHHADVIASNGAVFSLVFHRHAIDEHFVKGAVVGQER